MDTERLQRRLREFAEARDWGQFHSPKNLATALMCEAGELAEIFQWLTEEQSRRLEPDSADMSRVREELADVAAYLLRLADVLGVNLERAIDEKITANEGNYPVGVSRGNAIKYNRR